MNPILDNVEEENDILSFRIQNINVSYANAIRRTILADIPTVVFRTSPYEKNKAKFEINTSKFNNEVLKQRLSCIPIHIHDLDIPLDNLLLTVDVYNQSSSVIYVTTDDFNVLDKNTNKIINMKTNQLFPHNEITKSPIDFCRLQPQISEQLKGEHLKFTCEFDFGTAKSNGSFNVVSTCTYKCTIDSEQVAILEAEKRGILENKYADMYANYTGSDDVHKRIDESIETELNDWRILDSPRITIPDSYEFRIQTVGVFENKYILKKAMSIIIDSLKNIISIYSKANDLIKDSSTFMPNCYDVTLVDYDYTIGKILEYCLYEEYFLKESTLNFCAFKKFHPHLNTSVIRMAFKTETDITNASIYLINAAKIGIQFYKKILYQLGSEEYKSAFTDVKLLDVPVHTIAENEEQSDFIKPQPTPAASSATHAKMGSATPAASSATHAKMGSAPVPATKATKSRKTVTIVDE